MEKTTYQIILLDFIDERFNILNYNKEDESYITISDELLESKIVINQNNIVKYNSQQKLKLWISAFEKFLLFLEENNIVDKLIINRVFYSELDSNGNKNKNMNYIEEMNQILSSMYEVANSNLDDKHFIKIRKEDFISNPKHIWGMSPFHYDDKIYDEMYRQLTRFL